jgi:hypothetical protein
MSRSPSLRIFSDSTLGKKIRSGSCESGHVVCLTEAAPAQGKGDLAASGDQGWTQ